MTVPATLTWSVTVLAKELRIVAFRNPRQSVPWTVNEVQLPQVVPKRCWRSRESCDGIDFMFECKRNLRRFRASNCSFDSLIEDLWKSAPHMFEQVAVLLQEAFGSGGVFPQKVGEFRH